MIEFDWSKYETGNYDVVTLDGTEVKQLTRFDANETYNIIGVINGLIRNWNENGDYQKRSSDHINDLFLRPKLKDTWVALYSENGLVEVSPYYSTERDCSLVWDKDERVIKIVNLREV